MKKKKNKEKPLWDILYNMQTLYNNEQSYNAIVKKGLFFAGFSYFNIVK